MRDSRAKERYSRGWLGYERIIAVIEVMTGKYTISQLYRQTRDELSRVPADFPETEALLMCEQVFGFTGRAELAVRGGEIADEKDIERLSLMVSQRARRPLQYILGEWEFCDMSLKVGEGVLVPREDTAALVDAVCASLRGRTAPRLLDLCSGSGAVALAAVGRISELSAVCIELSQEAMPYLIENVRRYGRGRCEIIRADVLCQAPDVPALGKESFDVICANPPYIPSADIGSLSREVRQEPRMALDGGDDGLLFYRAITKFWLKGLRRKGALAVEIGEGQEKDVAGIFVRSGLENIGEFADMSGKIRAIVGTKA